MKRTTGGWLCVLLTAALLFVYYHFQIINANNITYSPYGDGYKNYYTFAYYLKFDWGTHFSGMNYPFGEHVMFTDNQPALAWLLKPVSLLFPKITDYSRLILVWLTFLSIIICSYFLFQTLTLFNVSTPVAIACSVCIALLSPQLHRMHTHYSLSYVCFVPGVVYFLSVLLLSKGSVKHTVWLAIYLTFLAFVHVYYAAMACLFLLLVALIFCITHIKHFRKSLFVAFQLAVAALLPIILLKLFLLLTDSVTDRPSNPWGFIESGSTWSDIFLHPYSITKVIFNYLFPSTPTEFRFEGTGYIGFIPLMCFGTTIVVLPLMLLIKKKWQWLRHPLFLISVAAVLVLLCATAFPFSTFPGTEKFYRLLPSSVKQFRAIGRFNWIFYYSIAIVSAVLVYKLFTYISYKNVWKARIFLFIVIGIWFYDAHKVSKELSLMLRHEGLKSNELNERALFQTKLAESGLSADSFQAIFPIGFFLNGSERIYIEEGNSFGSMKASLFTGLPIVCGQMSRTSESQTFSIARLMADEIMTKPIIDLYKNKKPLLVVKAYDNYTKREQDVLKAATHLFDINKQSYYSLPLSFFKSTADSIQKNITTNSTKYLHHGNYISNVSYKNVLVNSFDDQLSENTLFGNGAAHTNHGDLYLFFDTLPNATVGNYELSAWVYADERRPSFPPLYASQSDSNGVEIERYECYGKFQYNTFGQWIRCSIPFKLYHPKNKFYAASNGEFVTYDNLMIRPETVEVVTYLDNDSIFMFNNYPVRKNN